MDSYRDRARQLAGKSLLVGMSALSAAGGKVARAAAAGVGALTATDKEKVTAVRFASLDGPGGCPALLIAYETGFQVWSLEQATEPTQLVSRRDGPVRLMEVLPGPGRHTGHGGSGQLAGMFPVLALAPGAAPLASEPPSALRLYSLLSQATLCTLPLSSPALGLAASRQLLVVALAGQLVAYDGLTLEQRFTCVVHVPASPQLASSRPPASQPGLNSAPQADRATSSVTWSAPVVPFALGAAWLAYPSPQPVTAGSSGLAAARLRSASDRGAGTTGVAAAMGSSSGTGEPASPQSLSGAASELARAAVQRGGRSLAHAGSAGLRYLSGQVAAWRGAAGAGSRAGGGGPGDGPGALTPAPTVPAVAGTVEVRETGGRRVVAHFRAHGAPLAALAWDLGGTLLATASTSGRSVRLWRVGVDRVGGAAGGGGGPGGEWGPPSTPAPLGTATCLARLVRGMTPARIQSLSVHCPGDLGVGAGRSAGASSQTWFAPLRPGVEAVVSVVSGSGTAHVYELPAAAIAGGGGGDNDAPFGGSSPGSNPRVVPTGSNTISAPVSDGPRLAAAARVRRPGLLRGSGVVAAAGGAARVLRDPGGGNSGEAGTAGPGGRATSLPAFPAAAAWIDAAAATGASPGAGREASLDCCGLPDALTLLSVAADGLLLAHACDTVRVGAGSSLADPPSPTGSDGDGAGTAPVLTAPPPAAGLVMTELARWDVGRRYGWEECEVEMPGSPPTMPTVGSGGELAGKSGVTSDELGPSPADRQRWLAEALPVWNSWSEPELAARASVTLVPH